MSDDTRPVLVIGHINPDTDSVCSAICYARLKEAVTGRTVGEGVSGFFCGGRYV